MESPGTFRKPGDFILELIENYTHAKVAEAVLARSVHLMQMENVEGVILACKVEVITVYVCRIII